MRYCHSRLKQLASLRLSVPSKAVRPEKIRGYERHKGGQVEPLLHTINHLAALESSL
jgi:hypothetical protein